MRSSYRESPRLVAHNVAIAVMHDFRNQVSETVILSVRFGDFRVRIDFVEELHSMRRMADLDVQRRLYAGAPSKMLLADMEDDEIEAYLGRTDLTVVQESTITDPNVLWREIRTIRKRGFAESKGELFAGGGRARSANYSARTVAAIDHLTPERRYTAEHRERCIGAAAWRVPGMRPRGSAIASRSELRQPLSRGRDQCCQSAEIRLPVDLLDQFDEFVDC
jgi:DNA-binding IclR family transcriptional regulator